MKLTQRRTHLLLVSPENDNRKGSFSSVSVRQSALKELGYYDGTVDSLWGPASKGALIRFQEKNNLAAGGVWGPITDAAVVRALQAR